MRALRLGPFLVLATTASSLAQTTAIVNANVVDVRAGQIRSGATILVVDGKISRVGPSDSVPVPSGAIRIDAANSYWIPGLADMHAHFTRPEDLTVFLAYGVTVVQYLNAFPEMLDWRDSTTSGQVLGPEIFPCVGAISRLTTVDQANQAIADAATDGFPCIKPYDDITDSAYSALAAAARAKGLLSVSHIPRNLTWQQVLAARPSAIAHAEEFLYSPITSNAAIDSILNQMKTGGISLVTTIDNYAMITRQAIELPELLRMPELAYYSPVHQRLWAPGKNHYARDFKPARIPEMRRRLAFQQTLVKAMDSAGVRVLLGTDEGNLFQLPGLAVHDELQRLVLSGLSPAAALRAATISPAQFLGRDRELGTIETGRRADLVMIYGNPLRDITTTRLIGGVMRNGRWLPRDTLRAMLQSIRARYAAETRFLEQTDRVGIMAALATAAREHYLPDQRALNELAYERWRIDDDTANARRTFDANARLHPNNWIAHGSLGEFLLFAGDSIRARAELDRALRDHPRDRELRTLRAKLGPKSVP